MAAWKLLIRGEHAMNILFVSLGCDKNLVDTEVMLGLLAKKIGRASCRERV